MDKYVEFTPIQIKAKEAGATMFIVNINLLTKMVENPDNTDAFLLSLSPIQKGDKNIFIKEKIYDLFFDNKKVKSYMYREQVEKEKSIFGDRISYKEKPFINHNLYSRHSFKECIDIKIVKVNSISCKCYPKLGFLNLKLSFEDFYNQQMRELDIDRRYKDNDYIFLIELN